MGREILGFAHELLSSTAGSEWTRKGGNRENSVMRFFQSFVTVIKEKNPYFVLGVIKVNMWQYFLPERRILHTVQEKKFNLSCAVLLPSLRFYFLI